jgi:hypothetical protein
MTFMNFFSPTSEESMNRHLWHLKELLRLKWCSPIAVTPSAQNLAVLMDEGWTVEEVVAALPKLPPQELNGSSILKNWIWMLSKEHATLGSQRMEEAK